MSEDKQAQREKERIAVEKAQSDCFFIGWMIAVPVLFRFTSANWPWWAALLAASPVVILVFDKKWTRDYSLYSGFRAWVISVNNKLKTSDRKLYRIFYQVFYWIGQALGGAYVIICALLFIFSALEFFNFVPPPYWDLSLEAWKEAKR